MACRTPMGRCSPRPSPTRSATPAPRGGRCATIPTRSKRTGTGDGSVRLNVGWCVCRRWARSTSRAGVAERHDLGAVTVPVVTHRYREGDAMAHFLTLGRYSPQGAAAVKTEGMTGRKKAVQAFVEATGLKLLGYWGVREA